MTCHRDRKDERAAAGRDHGPPTDSLATWAELVLTAARRADNRAESCSGKVRLSKAQRRTIVQLPIAEDIRRRLRVDAAGPRTFHMTAHELASICRALARPLADAQGRHRNQLLKAAERIAQGLNDALIDAPKRPRQTPRTTAYQLKITLRDLQPIVWRRIQVLDSNLHRLHEWIQIVMGWRGNQPYRFQLVDTPYSDLSSDNPENVGDARHTLLSRTGIQREQRFGYVCGPRTCWRHTVEVESVFQPLEGIDFPCCQAGSGASPPDHVDGPAGYQAFLRAINDMEHPDYRRQLERCGGWFDPAAFDLEGVNCLLRKLN
jgi:hypothetical protein